MNRIVDLSGQRFGRLVAIRPDGRLGGGLLWLCLCDCGKTKTTRSSTLRLGGCRSCGCLLTETSRKNIRFAIEATIVHGFAGTPTYGVWRGMIERCTKKSHKSFKDYGGRGIKVCKRWLSFPNFLADMGPKPPKLTLDRIKNDGDYKPSNCKWSTAREQNNNRRERRCPHCGKSLKR
jgi:hypothetical protein